MSAAMATGGTQRAPLALGSFMTVTRPCSRCGEPAECVRGFEHVGEEERYGRVRTFSLQCLCSCRGVK